MLKFPDTIKNPSFPIDISYEDIALQSKKESGDTKIRKKFSEARITFNITWNSLTIFEYRTLENFYINDCKTDVNEFLWSYPSISDTGVILPNSVFHKHSFIVRFDSFSSKINEYNQYVVSVVLKGRLSDKGANIETEGGKIPIVYGSKITYLIDNTAIDGTLVWGPSDYNSNYVGFVNNYTDRAYFSDESIVDADMHNETSEVYTAYVRDPEDKNLYSEVYGEGTTQNEFKVQRNNHTFKDLDIDYLTSEARTTVFNYEGGSDLVREAIWQLPSIVLYGFETRSAQFLYQWANFKVDKEGYFKFVSIPYFYRRESFTYLKEGGKFKILGKLETEDESYRENYGGAIGRQYTKYRTIYSGYYREDVDDNYDKTKVAEYSYTIVFPTLLDDNLEGLFYAEPYVSGSISNISFVGYTSEEVPTGITPITYNYLGYMGGEPKPKFNTTEKKNEGLAKARARSGCTDASIYSQGYSPDSWYRGAYTVGQLTGRGQTLYHEGMYKCWYSVKCTFSYSKVQVPIESLLTGGFNSVSTRFLFDIPVQDDFVARFGVHKSSSKDGSFSFLGIYSTSGGIVTKPNLDIKITDNISFLVLASGDYLLGIHKKGLYRISKEGEIKTLVTSRLYNFRLNYEQK